MFIKIKISAFKKIIKEDVIEAHPYLSKAFMWKNEDNVVSLNLDKFGTTIIDMIEEYAKKNHKTPEFNVICQNISVYKKILANPKDTKVKSLQALPEALRQYIRKYAYKFMIGKDNYDGVSVYYVITNIVYTEYDKQRDSPAHVTMTMKYVSKYEVQQTNTTWYTENVKGGVTAGELLSGKNYFIMTEEVYKDYSQQIKTFLLYRTQLGEQFTTTGIGETSGYGSSWRSLSSDNSPAKLVCDEKQDQAVSDYLTGGMFWAVGNKKTNEDDDEMMEDDENLSNLEVPIHPYLYMFDLGKHFYVKVHVNNIKPYIYDPTIVDKLILPKEVKDLITVLVQGTDDIMEDIIRGKTGGIITIATGDPGVGKTLTAEAYSEVVKRPLYVVQSSQLGVNVDKLEEELKKVLERAVRWKAILLIDECDVYVHERGNNLIQNAVVGCFLRVLEYYRGILFMTSNRDVIIDDAIMSRATAWIKYPRPSTTDQIKIWRVLCDQFKIKITDKLIGEIVKEFDSLSGRDIKTLAKLANLMAKREKKDIDLALIQHVSQFHSISRTKKENKD